MAAIVSRQSEMRHVEGVGQQRDVAEAQAPLAEVAPVKRQIEIDPRFVMGEAQGLSDRSFGCRDASGHIDIAIGRMPLPRLGPFEVGDLVFTGRLEHAVAGVPISLQGDVVEVTMRQPAESGVCVVGKADFFQRQAASPVKRGLNLGRRYSDPTRTNVRPLTLLRSGAWRRTPTRFGLSQARGESRPALLGDVGTKIA